MRLFIQVRYKTQREQQHEVQTVKKTTTKKRSRKWKKKKNETSDNVLVLLWTLVCCSALPTAVECYLFIWIYFYEVCYWSELHIYFVNHECLRYKFVYFNNKCHTKQTCWYKTWIGYFKAFGPLSLGKQIYGTIHIFYWNFMIFNLWTENNRVCFSGFMWAQLLI